MVAEDSGRNSGHHYIATVARIARDSKVPGCIRCNHGLPRVVFFFGDLRIRTQAGCPMQKKKNDR
jgi:hypothetical protein